MDTIKRLASTLRAWWPSDWIGHPLRLVFLIAAPVSALGQTKSLMGPDPSSWLMGVAVIALGGIPLVFLFQPRLREWTILLVGLILTVVAFTPELRFSAFNNLVMAYACFLIGAHSPRRLRPIWLGWATAGVLVVQVLSFFHTPWYLDFTGKAISTVVAFLVLGFFYLLGAGNRKRREERIMLAEKAEMAGAMERNRIAREMHDIVAHNLAGTLTLADGAQYAAKKNPEAAVEALRTISSSTRESLRQKRGLLSVLRDPEGRQVHSAPGAADVERLFREAQRTGLKLTVTGAQALPSKGDELYQFTIYRVIQEAITNMLKYAEPKRGTIVLRENNGGLTIDATNPIDAAGAARHREDTASHGFGLVGMRERVATTGGRIDYSVKGDFFQLHVEVPE